MTSSQLGFAERNISYNGRSLHYLDWGGPDAEPILLLHSLSGICRDWDYVAASLSDRYRVIALDMPGFGGSDRDPAGKYQPEDLAQAALALADAVGLRSLTLVGHSLGGRAAIELAARNPERVRKLVLVDVGPEYDAQGLRELRQRISETPTVFETVEAAGTYLRDLFKKTDAATYFRWLNHYLRPLDDGRFEVTRDPLFNQRFAAGLTGKGRPPQPDLWQAWQRIQCPVLVLRGSESNLLTLQIIARMVEAKRALRAIEIEGSGHNIPADNPDALIAAVREFIEG